MFPASPMSYPYSAEYPVLAGLDLPTPPWWGAVPIAMPAAAATWASDLYSRNVGSAPRRMTADVSTSAPSGPSPWPSIVKIALVVGGALAIYGIYRGSKAAEKFSGPIHGRVGEAAVRMLKARGGKVPTGRYAGRVSKIEPEVEVLLAERAPRSFGFSTREERLLPA